MRTAVLLAAIVLAPAPSAAQSRVDRRAADRLSRAAQDLYARGQYAEAAQSFHAAYEKVQDASFLFNEARAYERANDLEKAIAGYRAYLSAAPDATDVVEVEGKIATLEARQRARETGTGEPIEPEPEAEPTSEATATAKFHTHTVALTLAPVFWLDDADDKFRVAGEYRYGLSEAHAIAGQLMYIPDLVSGRTNSSSGLGAGVFYLRTVPLFDPFTLSLRAGIAFEGYSSRSADAQVLALRAGPGLAYALTNAVSVAVEALFSPGLFFLGSNTLAGDGGGTSFIITIEPAASLVLGI